MGEREPRAVDEHSMDAGDGYSYYVLAVLVLVSNFNFLDRVILSILAEDIKADLGLSDASLGFLYGTVFAVFFATFGIALSRLADVWIRKDLIAIGLFFWSAMTALSGLAQGFASLTMFRIGVGIGEASASPAAYSMLGDYFPPRLRATALSIYASGIYVGAGIGLFIGGQIVDRWNKSFPAGTAPFGLAGWQVAFFAVGLPGLLLALWVRTLREPIRGQSEGLMLAAAHTSPIRVFGSELASILPPLTLVSLHRVGVTQSGLGLNMGIAAACVIGAWSLTAWIGSPTQWIALAIGLYSFLSWIQILALRDRATFGMIYQSRAVVFGMIGFGWMAFINYGLGFWSAPFLLRAHHVSAAQAGTFLGLIAAAAGWIGAMGGGIVSDRLKQRTGRARLFIGLISSLAPIPAAVLFLTTDRLILAYISVFILNAFGAAWIGPAIALSNELVMPRMRAAASASGILCTTFLGLAMGPYTIGKLSDWLSQNHPPAEALRTAMLLSLVAAVPACAFLWLSSRHVEFEEANRLERARALGEAVHEA